MTIYLKYKRDRLRIPLSPDKFSVKRTTNMTSFTVLKTGDHKMPRGVSAKVYSWSGVFPGKSMSKLKFIKNWQQPNRIIKTLEKWQQENAILTLTVTDSVIKDEVFIDSFSYDYFGVDNVSYSISFTQNRKLTVSTAKKQDKVMVPRSTGSDSSSGSSTSTDTKTTKPTTKPTTDTDPTPVTVHIPTTRTVDTTPVTKGSKETVQKQIVN